MPWKRGVVCFMRVCTVWERQAAMAARPKVALDTKSTGRRGYPRRMEVRS